MGNHYVELSQLALVSGVIVIAATVCGAAGYFVGRVMATSEKVARCLEATERTQASQLKMLENLEEDIQKLIVSNKQILGEPPKI